MINWKLPNTWAGNAYNNYITDSVLGKGGELAATNLRAYLDAGRRGINFFRAYIFEEIRRRDMHIAGVLQTRKLAVLGEKYSLSIDYNAFDKNPAHIALETLESINFNRFITDCVESQITGCAAFELDLVKKNNFILPVSVAMVPHWALLYDERQITFLRDDIKLDELRNHYKKGADFAAPLNVEDDPRFLLIEGLDGNARNPFLNGMIDSLLWAFFFKYYGLKDYAIFVERFATPAVIATYDSLLPPQDRIALENAVGNFGHLFRMIAPEGVKVELLGENFAGNADIFREYIRYWDEAIAIRVLGNTLTTAIGDKGSFAAAKVHEVVREDLWLADLALVEEAVNMLINKVIRLNLGNIAHGIKFKFDIDSGNEKSDFADMLHRSAKF